MERKEAAEPRRTNVRSSGAGEVMAESLDSVSPLYLGY